MGELGCSACQRETVVEEGGSRRPGVGGPQSFGQPSGVFGVWMELQAHLTAAVWIILCPQEAKRCQLQHTHRHTPHPTSSLFTATSVCFLPGQRLGWAPTLSCHPRPGCTEAPARLWAHIHSGSCGCPLDARGTRVRYRCGLGLCPPAGDGSLVPVTHSLGHCKEETRHILRCAAQG